MKKLLLSKEGVSRAESYNVDTLLSNFAAATFTPDFNTARFSNPAVASQKGFFQRINGLIYIYIELCPDINNPFGGGANVSFTSGDTISLPLPCIEAQVYTAGDWIGHGNLQITNITNKTKYTDCYAHTNSTTGAAEIVINHNIGHTAATFSISGFYLSRG
jgi:hypothetical protein